MGSDMVVDINAVRRQSSKWVTDCFTQSADVPDRPCTVFREVKDSGVKSASERQKGRRSTQKCDRQAKQRAPLKIEGTQKDESGYRSLWRVCFECGCAQSDNPNAEHI